MSEKDAADTPPCAAGDDAEVAAEDEKRPGLPDPATVVSEQTLISPKGRRYRILRTRQTDPYDGPAQDKPERQP